MPREMICALRAFLDFCYLVRRNGHDRSTLQKLQSSLADFHEHCEIFVKTGVQSKNTWPIRQHSMVHYIHSIQSFGSPNGLCSSITESKHIKAVKKPWRRSNRYNALKQMLVINSRSDKLRSAYNRFKSLGMLDNPSDVTDSIEGWSALSP